MVSTAPDITEGLPLALPSAVAESFPATTDFDVTIGQLGFQLRPSEANPYQRATEPARKQQLDTSESPGEQSLSSWWVRSQDSWHRGAGIRWFEPGKDAETEYRFEDSSGVDVWTPGEVTLLPSLVEAVAPAAGRAYVSTVTTPVVGVIHVRDDTVSLYDVEGNTVGSGTLTGVGATQPAVAGNVALVGHSSGIDKFDIASQSIEGYASSSLPVRVWWAKSRIIAAVGTSLYEVPLTGASTVEAGALLVTHPDASWVWSDVTETAGAVLASGYAGGSSSIWRLAVQDNEGVPELVDAGQVAHFPPGETVTSMAVYLGSVLVLGTSAGVRLGEANDAGAVRYGPVIVETESPAVDITFVDRFAYLATSRGGNAAVLRVDISAPSDQVGRFAYAWDVSVDVVDATPSVALVGNRATLAAGGGLFLPSLTHDTTVAGWLATGGIRFATTEPKAFRLARVSGDTNGGIVRLIALVDGSGYPITSFSDAYPMGSDVPIQIPGRTLLKHLDLRLVLEPGPTASPVVTGIAVKAVPAPGRVRLYRFPLSVFDQEVDRYGNRRGGKGFGYERLRALEALEETAAPVRITDNRTGETFFGQVDLVDFSVDEAPDGPESGFGGVANVTIRRV